MSTSEPVPAGRRGSASSSRALRRSGQALLLVAFIFACGGPGHAQIAVAGDLISIEENLAPGDSYSGAITVRNVGGTAASAEVYLRDVLFEGDEQAYVEPDSLPRSNASWIELELSSVQLEGGESASISYTVTVPDASELRDSYWSMVMVENAPDGGTVTDEGVQIRSVTRYGVYLVSTMSERTAVRLDVTDPRLRVGDQGEWILSVAVSNAGERMVRPETYLDLYDASGVHVGRVDGQRALMFPGARIERAYRLGRPTAGTYTGIVVLDAGGDDVFGARYTLKIEDP